MSNSSTFILKEGDVFGRYTVVGEGVPYIHPRGHIRPRAKCVCQCGKEKDVRQDSLLRGTTLSCGCWNRDKMVKHGMEGTKEYLIWSRAKSRAMNINNPSYKDYMGRGINISDAWLNFEVFFNDMGYCPEGHSLHRIDNDGDYSKENCAWAEDSLQNHVKRNWGNCEYKGVSFKSKDSLYQASIRKDNINYHLGSSKDPLICAKLYDDASEKFYGDRPNGTTKCLDDGDLISDG